MRVVKMAPRREKHACAECGYGGTDGLFYQVEARAFILTFCDDCVAELWDKLGKAVKVEEPCRSCPDGIERNCPHSIGRHYDPWGEGIATPDWCPEKVEELPWC